MSELENKVKALHNHKTLYVDMPLELFDLLKQSGHLGDDLWVNLLIIDALRREGWIVEEKKG